METYKKNSYLLPKLFEIKQKSYICMYEHADKVIYLYVGSLNSNVL